MVTLVAIRRGTAGRLRPGEHSGRYTAAECRWRLGHDYLWKLQERNRDPAAKTDLDVAAALPTSAVVTAGIVVAVAIDCEHHGERAGIHFAIDHFRIGRTRGQTR